MESKKSWAYLHPILWGFTPELFEDPELESDREIEIVPEMAIEVAGSDIVSAM